jgi:hypothetical protein
MLSRQLAEVGKGWAKRKFGEGKADIRSSFGKLNDPGKPLPSRLGILPRQLRTSPFVRRPPLFAPDLMGRYGEPTGFSWASNVQYGSR